MIRVDEDQTDALTELVNIAFGLTAAKLSEITGQRVEMVPPVLTIESVSALTEMPGSLVYGPFTSVCQDFTGRVSGTAALLLNSAAAQGLGAMLAQEDCFTDEILIEVGNMLLSSCIGMIGNLFNTRIDMTAPRLQQNSLELFPLSLASGRKERQYAIVIASSFKILKQRLDGRLLLILGVSSLRRLIQAVTQWDSIQLSA